MKKKLALSREWGLRHSLGLPLFLGLAGLQLLAVLTIVFTSYITSEKVLMFHARNLLRNVGMNTMEHSRGFLKPAHDAAELSVRLAQNRIIASDDPVLMEQLLFQQLQLASQLSGMYYGDPQGGFVFVMRDAETGLFRSKIITVENGVRRVELIWRDNDFNAVRRAIDPADSYDPRTRNWFRLAVAQRKTVWADPYIFFSSRQPGITLAAPVFGNGGAVRGVVGVDIEISEISDFLSRLKIGRSGRAIIINGNGDVIAGQDPAMLRTKDPDGTLRFYKIGEYGDPIARAAFGGLFRPGDAPPDHEEPGRLELNGKEYVSLAMPILSESLPWTIAVYAPEKDFIAEIKHNRVVNTWIAVGVALVTGLIGLLLANRIHRPVRAFAVRSALIAQGELDPDEPMPRTYRELEAVNDAMMAQIAARRDAEREYGLTFEMSSRGMAQIDPATGQFLRANNRLCDMTGRSAEALTGLRLDDLIMPADRRFLSKETWLGAGDRDVSSNRAVRMLRPDGRVIWVRINAIMIRDSEGAALHSVLTLEDVTRAREKESQIDQLNREMSLLARGNTMGQLANGLAHELNQPLVAIAQNAGTALFLLQQRQETDPDLKEALCEIEGQSLRAGEIINALRGLLNSSDAEDAPPIRIDELVEQVQRLIQHEAEEAGVTMRVDCPPGLRITGNRVQIAQVLVNLLRNAIEAFAGCQREARFVTTVVRRLGDTIRIEVQDNGPGVDPAVTLFAQFETTKPDGLGLGLSICRSLAQANGGRLWYEAPPEGGALFCLSLPAARDDTAEPGAEDDRTDDAKAANREEEFGEKDP